MSTDSGSLPYSVLLRECSEVRAFTLKFLESIDAEEAMRIPPGFANHLHWQLGHLLFAQGAALFLWSGRPLPYGRGFKDYFGRGSNPADYDSLVPDWDELKNLVKRQHREMPSQVAGRLDDRLVKPIQLMDITMNTTGETLPFLMAHEGEHIAHIKRLRKAVRPA
jgi:hypothetical protein